MNTPSSPGPPSGGASQPPSKLFIRSEVLAVVGFLMTVEGVAKHDRAKQLKRLRDIADRKAVLGILIKELQRTTNRSALQVISDLLTELGELDTLREPLWELIQTPGLTDEVKDTANLVLRHLGDESAPELYLEYLEDPIGLINRETQRMLEAANQNPEIVIDFIDFIFSLPQGEQVRLVQSLQVDYPPDQLVNLYLPMVQADCPEEIRLLILRQLGQVRDPQVVQCLTTLENYSEVGSEAYRAIQKSLRELKLAGVEASVPVPAVPNAITEESQLYQCYATLPDGIGNQGMVLSRRWPTGDVTLVCVALNDLHGILDCFGFFQMAGEDFDKIVDKFHEGSAKIQVPPEYGVARLEAAEGLNWERCFRIPYEYSCWKPLLSDISLADWSVPLERCCEWADPKWASLTEHLYTHPDFQTWFLEEDDHPVATDVLGTVAEEARQAVSEAWETDRFVARMDTLGEALVQGLMATEWRDLLLRRLADAAFLLNCQGLHSFCAMAATEVLKLVSYGTVEDLPHVGFIRQYGRRCVEEELLRLQQGADGLPGMAPLLAAVLTAWQVEEGLESPVSS